MVTVVESPADVPSISDDALRAVVRQRHVCWDVIVDHETRHGEILACGHDIVLMAARRDAGPADPGDLTSLEIFADLERLAHALLPDHDSAATTIEGYEPAFHLRPQGGWAPELQLVIEVRDPRALRHIESRLGDLGVPQGTWQEPAPPASRKPDVDH